MDGNREVLLQHDYLSPLIPSCWSDKTGSPHLPSFRENRRELPQPPEVVTGTVQIGIRMTPRVSIGDNFRRKRSFYCAGSSPCRARRTLRLKTTAEVLYTGIGNSHSLIDHEATARRSEQDRNPDTGAL